MPSKRSLPSDNRDLTRSVAGAEVQLTAGVPADFTPEPKIHPTIDEDGRKATDTTEVVHSPNEEFTLDLLDFHSMSLQADIRGRGTTRWRAFGPKLGAVGEQPMVLVKDTWHSEGRTPEYACLEKMKGLNSVRQVLHYEGHPAEAKDLREPPTPEEARVSDRILLRLVAERRGQSLRHFTSQSQAIAAVRDTILTHLNMIRFEQILHRDISTHSILLGLVDEDALPGLRGILVDFDTAVHVGPRGLSSVSFEHPTVGTRMFQSCSVLRSCPSDEYEPDMVLPHDYLDDLESFFFVLTHLLHGWDGVEKRVERLPAFFKKWAHEDPIMSLDSKHRFFTDNLDLWLISPFWETPCRELLTSFHGFFEDIFLQKRKVRRIVDPVGRIQKLKELYESFEDHYNELKAMFDKALKELDELRKTKPTQACPAPVAKPNRAPVIIFSPFNAPPALRPVKRGSGPVDESDELGTPSKRSRTTVGIKSHFAEAMDAQNETVRD